MERVDPGHKTAVQIRRMFDGIAPRYDLLNRLLSAGMDRGWRSRAVRRALDGMRGPLEVLDVCCGTGDLSLEFAAHPAVGGVLGADFAGSMVRRAQHKGTTVGSGKRTRWLVADALRLPLRDRSFDVVSVAFGLRNLVDPVAGIAEFQRLLRPGGRLLVLEFLRPPPGAAGALLRTYVRHVLPVLGRWLSGPAQHDAYRYLPASIDEFVTSEEVAGWCEAAGLRLRERASWTLGTVALLVVEAGDTQDAPGAAASASRSSDGLAQTLNQLECHSCA